MMYIDFEYYTNLYGDEMSMQEFNRLDWEACKRIDLATTGFDGIKKLKVAFPIDDNDAECVKRCVAKLINTGYLIKQAEKKVNAVKSYIEREDGTIVSKIVNSESSGCESINYSNINSLSAGSTVIDSVLSSKKAQDDLYREIIKEYLSGICDANGVSLLYMGC